MNCPKCLKPVRAERVPGMVATDPKTGAEKQQYRAICAVCGHKWFWWEDRSEIMDVFRNIWRR